MINIGNKNPDKPDQILTRTIKISSVLALIFTIPALGIFLGIYYGTGNLLIGAVVGFGTHFVTLAFSERISKYLTRTIG